MIALKTENLEDWMIFPVPYPARPTWTGNPCSQTPLWYLKCSLSTGWSSSWRWSGRCSLPQRMSSTRWGEWNTPGSSHIDRTRSSQSPCTSLSSGTSWWRLLLDHESVRIYNLPAVRNYNVPLDSVMPEGCSLSQLSGDFCPVSILNLPSNQRVRTLRVSGTFGL